MCFWKFSHAHGLRTFSHVRSFAGRFERAEIVFTIGLNGCRAKLLDVNRHVCRLTLPDEAANPLHVARARIMAALAAYNTPTHALPRAILLTVLSEIPKLAAIDFSDSPAVRLRRISLIAASRNLA